MATKNTKHTTIGKAPPARVPKVGHKLTPASLARLHETRARVLHGRRLPTNSTDLIRAMRDGRLVADVTTYDADRTPPR